MSLDPAIQSVVNANQSSVQSQIGVALQAKALEAVQLQGDAAIQLLEGAVELSKSLSTGKSFDAVG